MELAAAKLALSVLSPIINKLGSYVRESCLGGDVTAEEIRKLTTVILPTIKTVIQEADFVPSDHLKPWLEDLQAAAYEAEDLIDIYEYNKIKNQVSSLPKLIKKSMDISKKTFGSILPKSSFKVSFGKLQKSAEQAEKLHLLIDSAHKIAMKQLEYKSPQASTSTSTSTSTASTIFGRGKECDIVIKFLLNESNADSNGRMERIPIIAIKGIGGSGKTTTTQSIYNDERVKIFDLKMWVHVSRSFDVHRLTKEIIESAGKGECPRIDNLDVLQEKLKELISKEKRFLLVLDDIWCENMMQWDQLLSPLNKVKGSGSRIIITTRMEKVASILQVDQVVSLEDLETKECWSILKHYAFGNSETTIEDMKLENVGNQIISKVKYSPLALRVVGSLLYKQVGVNEWENIFRQDILKETMDVLLLSFQHLPSHLQRCFVYSSLFPKGYMFFKCGEELVFLWIAQGFVENTNESELTLEEKGRIYFKELLSYSFFETQVTPSGDCYKIHDLLHDLAENISKGYCHRIEDDSLNIPPTCIHLSVWTSKNLREVDILDMSKLRNLRTFSIYSSSTTDTFKSKKVIFQNLTKLRTLLVLSGTSDFQKEVFGNFHIVKMKHLRYLTSDNYKLPELLLAKLYHLQFLRIEVDLHQSKRLFQHCENLVNLRILNLSPCFYPTKLDNYPECNIDKLMLLQRLDVFHPKKDGENRMMPLKNLHLHGSLKIIHLENVKSKTEAAEAMLYIKKNLDNLEFRWSNTQNDIDDSNSCEDVLEGLEPQPNLIELNIFCYPGVKVPNWMIKENWLPYLASLDLLFCQKIKEIPYLPPRLKTLYVEDCCELIQLPPLCDPLWYVKLVGCSKLIPPSMSKKLLCLSDVTIIRCARYASELFRELPFLTNLRGLELVGYSNLQTFPKLSPTVTNLYIEDFPNLTGLENLWDCTSLRSVTIKNCPMLMTSIILSYLTGPLFLQSSKTHLHLCGLHRPFPPLLEEKLHQPSPLLTLCLEGFMTIPSLDKFSSLLVLRIMDCPGVELLPNLPISLQTLVVRESPNLKLKYEEGGTLRHTISHIPHLDI